MRKIAKASNHFSHGASPSASGFTLLEIMIALAILGITLTVILHTVNFQTGIMHDNTVTTRIYQLAKEKMYELESSQVSSKGKIEGTVFTYENIAIKPEDSFMVELKTIIRGQDIQVSLIELIRKKDEFN